MSTPWAVVVALLLGAIAGFLALAWCTDWHPLSALTDSRSAVSPTRGVEQDATDAPTSGRPAGQVPRPRDLSEPGGES